MMTSTLWDGYGEKIGTLYPELEAAIEQARNSGLRFVVLCDGSSVWHPWFLPTNTPELYGAIRWMNEELYGK